MVKSSAEPAQHIKVVDGKIGQHAAVRARRIERLSTGCGRDLLRVDDYGLANGAQHSLRNRFSQVYVSRCEAQREAARPDRYLTQFVPHLERLPVPGVIAHGAWAITCLPAAHGFLDYRRLIAIGRSHDDSIYSGFRKERRKARKDRHTIPTCRRHTESPAAFGDGYQVSSLMSAQPIEHAVDLVVL